MGTKNLELRTENWELRIKSISTGTKKSIKFPIVFVDKLVVLYLNSIRGA